MNGSDSTLTGGFYSAFGWYGDVLFNWMPAIAITGAGIGGPGVASTTALASLPEPLSSQGFGMLLSKVSAPGAYDSLVQGWHVFTLLSFFLGLPFIAIALYSAYRISQIRRAEDQALEATQASVAHQDVSKTQLRWNRILEQASSANHDQERLAVLEADIMLSELLDLQSYRGETMADKLKAVDRADFNSIDLAWEAHKIRNKIAHQATGQALEAREVRHAITLYERVFREFKFVE